MKTKKLTPKQIETMRESVIRDVTARVRGKAIDFDWRKSMSAVLAVLEDAQSMVSRA
jgi:hypothetical protein